MLRKILPPTIFRVPNNTDNRTNNKIKSDMINRLNIYKDSDESVLTDRINELNYEWDTERTLEANAASIILLSSCFGFLKSRKTCFLLTGAAGFFLLQHAMQGWCPPVPFIRDLGIRTENEILKEKMAYKVLRGDFNQTTKDVNEIMNMVEK